MADDEQQEINRIRERMHDLNEIVQATILRHATIDANVTHLINDFREHRDDSKTFMRETVETLRKIQDQTTRTNGRVDAHDREFSNLKRHTTGVHEQRRASDREGAVTITLPAGAINAKTIAMVISGVLAGLIAAWKAGLFG